MALPHANRHGRCENIDVNPLFTRAGEESVPRDRLPERETLPDTAYQVIHDELLLDGHARQNLATFVTTRMEPQARQLYAESADKNMIDKDEYPMTAAIEERCVHIIAGLWHCPEPRRTMGVSTVGSSEACMLAGLALKRRWQRSRRAAEKSTATPNIVFSSAVQVVWEKFANYWEVEPRYVPVTEERPSLTAQGVLDAVDENTIGVVPILGVTYTGAYEPVADIASGLDGLHHRTGLDIPIHVDAASGGFVAPFLQPDLDWDFRLGRTGYTRVQESCREVAAYLAKELAGLGRFDVVGDGTDLPVVVWRQAGPARRWDLYDVSNKLRERGWLVPAYPLPADLQDTIVTRVVVRNGVSMDLAHLLVADIKDAVGFLDQLEAPMPRVGRDTSTFHH
ncbi:pyridoxal-dependent decarboxylase [Actinopolymorpha sp. B11F2]|uniref:pyridoxal-dependent decarboxylase n=1 Tax=Actinopolymorpha sp. B11F2 TaxID=3160862 RepID=UPI0032E4F70B